METNTCISLLHKGNINLCVPLYGSITSVWCCNMSCSGLIPINVTPNSVSGCVVNTLRLGREGEDDDEG